MQTLLASIWTLLAINGYFSLWGFGQTLQADPSTWPLQLIIATVLLGVPATIIISLVRSTK